MSGFADDTPSTKSVVLEDCEDIKKTLNGDDAAYERLVFRYQEPLAAYMWRFTRNRGERDELVQDVFVEAYISLKSYAGRAPLLHWLKRIATRVGYRFWKSQRERLEVPLHKVDEMAQLESGTGETELHAAELVHYLLAQLKHRDRLILTLVYLEECTIKEAAELTGWSQAMVKVQTFRARRRLAKICHDTGVEL